jgi:hypothetical protein
MADGRVSAEAVARASLLLTETELFAEFGMADIAATARMVALDVLDLADQLEAERSARVATQQRLALLEATVARGAYYGAIAQAATDAQATVLAKKHIDQPSGIEWPTKGATRR